MNLEQLKQAYKNNAEVLRYIDYLMNRFRTVEVYEDFHQLVHLFSDIEDLDLRFDLQRAVSYVYFYFPIGASIQINPIENDFEVEFTTSNEVIYLDAKRVKIPLQKFKDLDDAELDDFFQFGLED